MVRNRIVLALLTVGLLAAPVSLRAQTPAAGKVTQLLRELSDAPGPSGFEGPVRGILRREFQADGLEISTDGLGSIIGVLRGSSPRPRIMLAAHMDEVGAIVRYITPQGMVKFQLLGGWRDQALVDQRWTILTAKGPVLAVSGLMSGHITPPSERMKVIPHDDVFLDVGAKSQAQAEALGIRPGDGIAPVSSFQALAYGRYVGKALDDRLGCLMMIEMLRQLKAEHIQLPNTIYFVGTVQEEIGSRGAETAVQIVKPDIGISLEAGVASDFPGASMDRAQERLGFGPAINLADRGTIANLKLRDFFLQIAHANNLPLQTQVMNGGFNDSEMLQRYDGGRPAINFAIPVRYLHAHNSVFDRSDLEHAVQLLMKILPQLNASTVAHISSF
ncbi:MAG: M42 family metallopeptidase [Terriglobia bacterium]